MKDLQFDCLAVDSNLSFHLPYCLSLFLSPLPPPSSQFLVKMDTIVHSTTCEQREIVKEREVCCLFFVTKKKILFIILYYLYCTIYNTNNPMPVNDVFLCVFSDR